MLKVYIGSGVNDAAVTWGEITASSSDAFITLTYRTTAEVDALAAMRRRSDDLRQSVISMAEELADQETAQIGHLQMRLDTLREGSEEVTSSFARSQDDALDKLRARKSEFQEEIAEVVSLDHLLKRTSIILQVFTHLSLSLRCCDVTFGCTL